MPKAVRDFFTSRQICGYVYKDLPENVAESMIRLGQKGTTLSASEKLRAKSTELAQLAKQYAEDYAIVTNRKITTPAFLRRTKLL